MALLLALLLPLLFPLLFRHSRSFQGSPASSAIRASAMSTSSSQALTLWTSPPWFRVIERDDAFADGKKSDVPGYVILNTSKGSITIELYKEGSPKVVDAFIDLCRRGHFKGMPFHHVIKNFVIQGGNSDIPGATDDWTLKVKHNSQLETSMKHEAFMLGTTKAKHDKEGFELFITTAPIPDLNEKLIVFGRVIKGEDVVQEIEEVDTDEHYRPKSPIGIINVTLKEKV
ncbi:unnamed protein product [Camellia sinensis]